MDFVNYSDLNPLIILFSFGLIGGIFDVIGTIGRAIFGGQSGTTTTTTQIDYKKQLADQKEEFVKQMALQEQESKKRFNVLMIGAGAFIFIILIFFLLMKKR